MVPGRHPLDVCSVDWYNCRMSSCEEHRYRGPFARGSSIGDLKAGKLEDPPRPNPSPAHVQCPSSVRERSRAHALEFMIASPRSSSCVPLVKLRSARRVAFRASSCVPRVELRSARRVAFRSSRCVPLVELRSARRVAFRASIGALALIAFHSRVHDMEARGI